jgi:uncharacterized protein YkwD
MFHVKHPFLFLCFLFPLLSLGQASIQLEQKAFVVDRKKDSSVVQFLLGYSSLQKRPVPEQEAFYWVNLLRKDPASFCKHYIEPFLLQFPSLNGSEAESLRAELRALAPLGQIAPAAYVQKEAERHALDLAQRQKTISHQSSDGRTFAQRMADAGIKNCAGENVFLGEEDALKALILLLIDQGIPNLGHRKALLNPTFNVMGVSFKRSADSTHYMVQLFSCQ